MSTDSGSCKSVGGCAGPDEGVSEMSTWRAPSPRIASRFDHRAPGFQSTTTSSAMTVASAPCHVMRRKRIVPAIDPVGASTVMRPPLCATIRATTNGSPRSLEP